MGKIQSENGFSASPDFTGSQRPSYNQKLNFDLALENDIDAVDGARFVLEGTNEFGENVKVSTELSPTPSTENTRYEIRLHEQYVKPEYGEISSKDFITVLDNINRNAVNISFSRKLQFLEKKYNFDEKIGFDEKFEFDERFDFYEPKNFEDKFDFDEKIDLE